MYIYIKSLSLASFIPVSLNVVFSFCIIKYTESNHTNYDSCCMYCMITRCNQMLNTMLPTFDVYILNIIKTNIPKFNFVLS